MARNFDGTDEVSIVSNSDMNPTDNDYTMFCWVKVDSNLSGGSGSVRFSSNKGITNERHNMGINKSTGRLLWEIDCGTVDATSDTTDHKGAGWVCTSGVRDRSAILIRLYVSGLEADTDVDTEEFANGTGIYLIGDFSTAPNSGREWKGDIAENCFWKGTILSDAKMAALNRGVNPFIMENESIISYHPLYGNGSTGSPTEPDYAQGEGTNDVGTPSGSKATTHPPVELLENYI